jgi:hypothetical protein
MALLPVVTGQKSQKPRKTSLFCPFSTKFGQVGVALHKQVLFLVWGPKRWGGNMQIVMGENMQSYGGKYAS